MRCWPANAGSRREAPVDPLKLNDEDRQQAQRRLQEYFLSERDEELGELAVILLFDFIAEEVGPYFYNKGLDDANRRVEQLLAGIGEDLEAWKRFPPGPVRRRSFAGPADDEDEELD
jgi:uncharacterized protein (DUF2164 family)